jgi:tetratricopeptide (TPR) repeat protein
MVAIGACARPTLPIGIPGPGPHKIARGERLGKLRRTLSRGMGHPLAPPKNSPARGAEQDAGRRQRGRGAARRGDPIRRVECSSAPPPGNAWSTVAEAPRLRSDAIRPILYESPRIPGWTEPCRRSPPHHLWKADPMAEASRIMEPRPRPTERPAHQSDLYGAPGRAAPSRGSSGADRPHEAANRRISASGHARSPGADFARAEVHRQAGAWDEAIVAYADALLEDPRHRPSVFGLGAVLCEAGRWDEAARVYRHSLRLFADDAETTRRLAAMLGTLAEVTGTPPEPATAPMSGVGNAGRSAMGSDHGGGDLKGAEIDVRAGSPQHRVPRRSAIHGPSRRRVIRSTEPPRSDDVTVRPRARVVGLLSFPLVLSTYAVVGLATHFTVGLLAASLVALLLAALASLALTRYRWSAFKGILHGMVWGVNLVVIAGLVSMMIGATRPAPTVAPMGMSSDPIQIVIPLRWLECAAGTAPPEWCGSAVGSGGASATND